MLGGILAVDTGAFGMRKALAKLADVGDGPVSASHA